MEASQPQRKMVGFTYISLLSENVSDATRLDKKKTFCKQPIILLEQSALAKHKPMLVLAKTRSWV